jgi:sugar fermentation stimulation protein A
MRIEGMLSWARFISRTSRFTVLVDQGGQRFECYLANPGRLRELLIPDRKLLLRRACGNRKTKFDVIGAQVESQVVTIDSRIPNELMREAFQAEKLPEFRGYRYVRSEPRFGASRLDFLLEGERPCLVEVKSCTLVRDGTALFPDAPTTRGLRHLTELCDALNKGYRACIVFVVLRNDAVNFMPNWETDPKFSLKLHDVCSQGVEAIAYTTNYEERAIELSMSINTFI